MSRNYYPQTAQIATNMQEDVQEWKDVPLLRKYHNDRLSILADPEFLIIYWCKNFENFDSNQNCLLPSYPKSIFGSNFTPLEIKTVCERMIFYWMINDQISETESRKRFQELIPFLHDLVFTEDGFRILKYSFDLINDNAVKYSELLVNIRDTKLKLFLKEHDRIGVFSQGMPKPVIKTGCVLGLFLTFSYYYLPHTMEIYHVDTNVVNYFQRVTEKYHQELLNKSRVFYEFDYDYKLKKTIKKPIYFRFYCKDRISKINLFLGKPGYTTFLNTLQPILWCSVRSDKFK
jgi:hypothetical protein